jgi:[methyl-Co(III) methanol-specific corrinoid protein]:coenzyme M methyltransferase
LRAANPDVPVIGSITGPVSVAAVVSLRQLKRDLGEHTVMGNVSTYLLEFAKPERVRAAAKNLLEHKIDIIAPACGLSTSTPLDNIRAMTDQVIAGNA